MGSNALAPGYMVTNSSETGKNDGFSFSMRTVKAIPPFITNGLFKAGVFLYTLPSFMTGVF